MWILKIVRDRLGRGPDTPKEQPPPPLDLTGIPADPQPDSPLFKLPAEIRLHIFELVLGHEMIHLDMIGARDGDCDGVRLPVAGTNLQRSICTLKKTKPGSWRHKCWDIEPVIAQDTGSLLSNDLLSLPRACRRLYQESISLLYQSNKFDFKSFDSISGLFQCLPRYHIDSIRTVRLFITLVVPPRHGTKLEEPYRDIWLKLSTMKGLRELRVCIALHMQIEHILAHQSAYFDPLKLMPALETFECYIPPDTSTLPRKILDFVPGCRIAGWDVWKR